MAPGGTGIELAFTELLVADWPEAVRWYVEVLGLRKVLEDGAGRFALLDAGGGRLALKGSGPDGPRGVRLTFRVGDVDAEGRRLAGLGVAVGPPSDDLVEGYRSIRLHDPAGTPVTLFSWLEAGPGEGR